MSRQEIILNGLGCTNCAAKMERDINALDVIDNASIDFVATKLTIEASNGIDEQLQETIKSIVHKYEPDIIIEFIDENEHTKPKRKPAGFSWQDHKKELIKLGVGGVIFTIGLIFTFPTWLELVVFLASYLIVGSHVIWRAIMSIKSGQVFSEHFLMAIATIGAFIIGEFAEAVAVMLFYLVGELFQSMAINNSRRSISKLMDIRPDYANKKVGNNVRVVAPQDIAIGDIILVKPGERIPLDGQVIEGLSTVNTSALTGESMPKAITIGDEALSGYVNTSGLLSIQVSKVYTDSTVAKILDLVENAASKKSPTENFITKFARYYTPFVVFAALALAFIPPLLIADAQLSDWVYRALVFLVISCPCALVVSIPLGYFAGIGQASKRGILVKGGNYLDALNNVKTVVFDKTGTLTKGQFSVSCIKPQNDYTADELLEYAAYAESFSTHPIAVSLVKAYGKHIDKSEITDYKEIAGHGISANIKCKSVLVGNKKLISDAGIKVSENNDSYSQIHVAIDNTYAGYINVEDEIKEDAKQAITSLKASGIDQTIMFTGDKATTGEKIGNKLAVDKVYSQMLPADKVNQFEQLIARHNGKNKTAFVGDGINDAPVLARADIGIAMGGLGSDAAIEAADVVIMTDQPSKVSSAIKIAKKTRKIVWQNIILALGAKAIVMALGAVGIATMWLAVFADVGIALLAILNAMRMLNKNAKLD